MQICEVLHIFLANPKDFLIFVFLISQCIYIYRLDNFLFQGIDGGLRKLL